MKVDKAERVQKIIANSGFCSRRKAEELIKAGKVTINGTKVNLGEKALPGVEIMIGRQIVGQEKKVYIMLNKPRGTLCTVTDLFDRKTVTELIDVQERVYPVGRLDKDVEGLLLLTNDGDFANRIMHPSNEITKTYYVKLDKAITKDAIAAIMNGLRIQGQIVRGKIKKVNKTTVEITIHVGMNKVVKRIFKSLDYTVIYMRRIKIGNLDIKNLKVNQWRYLNETEVKKLLSSTESLNKSKVKVKKIKTKKAEKIKTPKKGRQRLVKSYIADDTRTNTIGERKKKDRQKIREAAEKIREKKYGKRVHKRGPTGKPIARENRRKTSDSKTFKVINPRSDNKITKSKTKYQKSASKFNDKKSSEKFKGRKSAFKDDKPKKFKDSKPRDNKTRKRGKKVSASERYGGKERIPRNTAVIKKMKRMNFESFEDFNKTKTELESKTEKRSRESNTKSRSKQPSSKSGKRYTKSNDKARRTSRSNAKKRRF